MKPKLPLAVATILLLGWCSAEDKPEMKPLPTIEEIFSALPFQKEDSNEKRIKMLSPYYHLVEVKDIVTAYEQDAIIEPKHPEQKWDSSKDKEPKYKENDAYFWLVAQILYWKCNVAESVPPAKQVKYISKQHWVLRDNWVDIVANVKLDSSRKLAVECLRADLHSWTVYRSFRDFKEWWGDPAKLMFCLSWNWTLTTFPQGSSPVA